MSQVVRTNASLMTTRVVGIDSSLTRTAVAIIDTAADYHDIRTLPTTGKTDATLLERATRIDRIASWVGDLLATYGEGLVVIEGPSFASSGSGTHDRAGLWWLIVEACGNAGLGVPVEVSPHSRQKYATGRGNAGKDEVLAAVVRRYPDAPVTNNDEADAWVLACMGARAVGHPVDDPLPQTHLAAMAKIQWPVVDGAEAVSGDQPCEGPE